MNKTKIFALLMLSAIFLAACGGAAQYSAAPEMAYDMDESVSFYGETQTGSAPMPGEPMYDEAEYKLADTTTATSVERMVIKNADVSIIVPDPLVKMDAISKMAEEMGGFVVDSNTYQTTLNNGVKVPHVSITVRVPAERLDEALEMIKSEVTEVESENISGQDVTSDYTDLSSRLRNLEAAEEQLMEIMDTTTDTENVLDVFNELTNVRGQIEVIKGQMKYYEEAAALSRVSVEITADEAVQPIQIGGWQPVGTAKDAVEMLIQTLQWLGDVGIWLVICVLPIGLIIGIPVWLLVRTVIRRRRRTKAEKAMGKGNDEILPEEEK